MRKGADEYVLKCLTKIKSFRIDEASPQLSLWSSSGWKKMRWLVRRYNYDWPTMLKDCIDFAKGCQAYQKSGRIQHTLATSPQTVIKPWPFRGWAMDVIEKISLPSSKNYAFILVAMDYFTKWEEAIPLKTIN